MICNTSVSDTQMVHYGSSIVFAPFLINPINLANGVLRCIMVDEKAAVENGNESVFQERGRAKWRCFGA
jgi:hypothetical protein